MANVFDVADYFVCLSRCRQNASGVGDRLKPAQFCSLLCARSVYTRSMRFVAALWVLTALGREAADVLLLAAGGREDAGSFARSGFGVAETSGENAGGAIARCDAGRGGSGCRGARKSGRAHEAADTAAISRRAARHQA